MIGVDVSRNARVEVLLDQLARIVDDEGQSTRGSTYLDERTRALAILGAAVCSDSSTRTFTSLVASAQRAGATDQEILGVLFAVAPAAGESRLVSVAPRISKALGYDVHQAFEAG